jgi:hypothetical protein
MESRPDLGSQERAVGIQLEGSSIGFHIQLIHW